MLRKHGIFVRGTKDTVVAREERPYQWRRRGITRDQALRRAGVGTARIKQAPEKVPE